MAEETRKKDEERKRRKKKGIINEQLSCRFHFQLDLIYILV